MKRGNQRSRNTGVHTRHHEKLRAVLYEHQSNSSNTSLRTPFALSRLSWQWPANLSLHGRPSAGGCTRRGRVVGWHTRSSGSFASHRACNQREYRQVGVPATRKQAILMLPPCPGCSTFVVESTEDGAYPALCAQLPFARSAAAPPLAASGSIVAMAQWRARPAHRCAFFLVLLADSVP